MAGVDLGGWERADRDPFLSVLSRVEGSRSVRLQRDSSCCTQLRKNKQL
jgi:hypothetical protein